MIADIEIEKYDIVKQIEWALDNDPLHRQSAQQVRRNAVKLNFYSGLLYCGLAWAWILLFPQSDILGYAVVVTIIWLGLVIVASWARPTKDLVAKLILESSPSRWSTLLTPIRLEVDERGVHIISEFFDGIRFWNSYSHAPLADTRLLLIQKDDSTLPVPKRCFGSDEAFAAFCNAIWNHLPQERPISG